MRNAVTTAIAIRNEALLTSRCDPGSSNTTESATSSSNIAEAMTKYKYRERIGGLRSDTKTEPGARRVVVAFANALRILAVERQRPPATPVVERKTARQLPGPAVRWI